MSNSEYEDRHSAEMNIKSIEARLDRWKQSLCPSISIAGLFARSPVAHKWKAPTRCIVVREAFFWRMHDIGRQFVSCVEAEHTLGALMLLRGALETLALAIYDNDKIAKVVTGELAFLDFEEATKKVLMGSKDKSTSIGAVNILTALAKAAEKYPNLQQMHQDLSEVIHPNFAGVTGAYSTVDRENFETRFAVDIFRHHGWKQDPIAHYAFAAFEQEYNSTATLLPQLGGDLGFRAICSDQSLSCCSETGVAVRG